MSRAIIAALAVSITAGIAAASATPSAVQNHDVNVTKTQGDVSKNVETSTINVTVRNDVNNVEVETKTWERKNISIIGVTKISDTQRTQIEALGWDSIATPNVHGTTSTVMFNTDTWKHSSTQYKQVTVPASSHSAQLDVATTMLTHKESKQKMIVLTFNHPLLSRTDVTSSPVEQVVEQIEDTYTTYASSTDIPVLVVNDGTNTLCKWSDTAKSTFTLKCNGELVTTTV